MSRPRRDLAPLVALAAVALLAGLAHGRLQPKGEPWSARFDPPYDNRTLRFQLKVYEWWAGGADTAIVPKGTKFPLLDDYCGNDPKVCPAWTLPGDLTLQFGPPTVQDAHRLNIFLSDTGNRVSVYAAPAERHAAGPCTGAPSAVCCGDAEYTLDRTETTHAVFKLWVSRPNGTVLNDGTQATNFRAARARLTVRAGFYTGTVSWTNMFHQLAGDSGDDKVQAAITLAADSSAAAYLDVASTLVNGYALLVPTNDPGAPGFVVPTAQLGDQPVALDVEGWRACRAARCGAPLGACVSQGPTPYAAHRGKTTASVIADSWNALGRETKKQCWVLGNSQWALQNPDLTRGDTVPAQLVGCDYQATYLAPIIKIPRALIEAGNTAPPPPSPPPPSPPPPSPPPSPRPTPSGTVSPAAVGSPSPTPSPSPAASPPPPPFRSLAPPPPSPTPAPPAPKTQGPALSLVLVLPAYTPAEFNATGKDTLSRALIKGAAGTTAKPTFRHRSVTTAAAAAASKSPRRLMAGSTATAVDLVMYFAPADATPALALLTALETDPGSVLPAGEFGDVNVPQAVALNCITPCGDHGKAGPRVARGGTVSCTCECEEGWSTAASQPFESFKYCTVATTPSSAAPGAPAAPEAAPDASNATVARPPPPPPKDYKEESGGGMSGGDIAAIVASLLFAALVAYFAWRTGCGCCKKMYAACAAATWTRCCAGKKVTQEESEDGDEEVRGAAATEKKKKNRAEGEGFAEKIKKKMAAPKAVKAQRLAPEAEEEEGGEGAELEAAERAGSEETPSPKKSGGRRKKGAGKGRGARRQPSPKPN